MLECWINLVGIALKSVAESTKCFSGEVSHWISTNKENARLFIALIYLQCSRAGRDEFDRDILDRFYPGEPNINTVYRRYNVISAPCIEDQMR